MLVCLSCVRLSLTGGHPGKSLSQFLKRTIEGAETEVQQIGFEAFLGHLKTNNFDVLKTKPVATELSRLAEKIDGMGKLTPTMRRKLTDLQVPFGNAIDPGKKRQRTPAAQSGGRDAPARPQLRVPIVNDEDDDSSYSPSKNGSDDDDESEDDEEQGKGNNGTMEQWYKEQGKRNKEQGTRNGQDATVKLSSLSKLLESHGLDAKSMACLSHIREKVDKLDKIDKIDANMSSIKEKVKELPVGTGTGEAVPTGLVETLEKAADKITETNDMIPILTNLQTGMANEK